MPQDQIQEIVEQAVLHSPTSFNSQSSRAVVLFGEQHDKLWDLTSETLRKIVAADQFEGTAQKMAAFKAGAGTVLFLKIKPSSSTCRRISHCMRIISRSGPTNLPVCFNM